MKYITVNIPLDLNKEVLLLAEGQKKTVTDVFRTAVRQYAAKMAITNVRNKLKKYRKTVKEEDIESILDNNRK
jgi:histone H3/H4